jgi:hypothetical protein
MVILQAVANSVSSIPYGIQFFYAAITLNLTKDKYRLAQENLFVHITRLSYYINFISAFYIYYISSQQIRSIIKRHFKCTTRSNAKEIMPLIDFTKSQLNVNSDTKQNSTVKTSSVYDE